MRRPSTHSAASARAYRPSASSPSSVISSSVVILPPVGVTCPRYFQTSGCAPVNGWNRGRSMPAPASRSIR
jgi:hypothetical protein